MDFDEIVVKESPGLCRCCLSEGCYKDLGSEYSWMSETEIYADMLLECFDISISQHPTGPNGSNRLICEVCITRLRDACNFKKQVLESEKKFVDMVGRGEFRPKVLLYQTQMKTEHILELEEETGADEGGEVEYLDEDTDFVDEDLLKNEDYGEASVSEDITVSSLSVKGKRGRPKKAPTKLDKKSKAKEEKPAKKAVAKDKTHKTSETTRRKNLETLFINTSVIPFRWKWNTTIACCYCKTKGLIYDELTKHTKSHHKSDIKHFLTQLRSKVSLKIDLSDMTCELCDENFQNLDNLVNHLVSKHKLKYDRQAEINIEQFKLIDLSCPLCKESFTEMEVLNTHVSSHSNNIQCELCSEMFEKKKDLRLHKQLVHAYVTKCDEEIEVEIKGEPIETDTEVKQLDPDAIEKKRIAKLRRENIASVLNMSTATPFKYYMNRFRCFYCSKSHPEFEPIKTHILTKHHYCDPEGIALKSIKGKDAIVKVDITSLACRLCCTPCPDLNELSDHLVSNHQTKHDKTMIDIVQPFKIAKDNMACPLCANVSFRYFVKLLEHMNESHSNNNVICVYCGQAFRSTPSYRGHLARYHRPNSCKCPDCDLVFPNTPKLITHRANAHGAKAFKCTKCSERFATQYLRQKHLIDAHGAGHKCTYCDRVFARNSFMKDHIRKLHLKEKNVECSVCKERFFDKTRLNVHMVKHIGERNYHCDICGKTFLWKKNLRGHMSSHKRTA